MFKNDNLNNSGVKMSFYPTHFPVFIFCGPHAKHHGVRGLNKHYHIIINTKLGNGTCEKFIITCECMACNSTLDKPWFRGISHTKQPY